MNAGRRKIGLQWVQYSYTHHLTKLDTLKIQDPVFQVSIAIYLSSGNRTHLCSLLLVDYLAKRANDSSNMVLISPLLPFKAKDTQYIAQPVTITASSKMKKLGGIQSEKEAVNFLLDKMGEPYITHHLCQSCRTLSGVCMYPFMSSVGSTSTYLCTYWERGI